MPHVEVKVVPDKTSDFTNCEEVHVASASAWIRAAGKVNTQDALLAVYAREPGPEVAVTEKLFKEPVPGDGVAQLTPNCSLPGDGVEVAKINPFT